MRSRSVFALVLLCLGVLAGPGTPAGAAPPPPPALVHVRDANTEYFLPSIVSVRQGGTVEWDFQGLHTATDNTGMGLYDSGEIKDATFSYRFVAAGTYAVICTLHKATMIGRIGVPVRVAPAKGTTKTRFAVTWSSTLAPAGFLFDVGKQRVGGAWSTWASRHDDPFGDVPPVAQGEVPVPRAAPADLVRDVLGLVAARRDRGGLSRRRQEPACTETAAPRPHHIACDNERSRISADARFVATGTPCTSQTFRSAWMSGS